MKSIEKKLLTGAIAASFLLGAGFLTQANAQDTTTGATVKAASGDKAVHGTRPEMGGQGGKLIQQTAALLNVDKTVVMDALKQGKSLAQFAQDKGMSEDTLIQKLVDAQPKATADAVAAGKLTQAQADKMTTGLADRVKKEVERTDLGKGKDDGENRGKGGFHGVSIIDETATILNVDKTVVTDALKQGKTLAQFAQEKGLTEDVYLQKLTDAQNKQIADAVSAGKLVQAQADKMKTALADQLKKKIESTKPFDDREGRGPEKGGFGPGFKPEVLTQALGMTQEELKAGREAGKSLSELAQAKGISEDQLIAKLKDGMTDQLKQFVQNKKQPQNPQK